MFSIGEEGGTRLLEDPSVFMLQDFYYIRVGIRNPNQLMFYCCPTFGILWVSFESHSFHQSIETIWTKRAGSGISNWSTTLWEIITVVPPPSPHTCGEASSQVSSPFCISAMWKKCGYRGKDSFRSSFCSTFSQSLPWQRNYRWLLRLLPVAELSPLCCLPLPSGGQNMLPHFHFKDLVSGSKNSSLRGLQLWNYIIWAYLSFLYYEFPETVISGSVLYIIGNK